MIDPEGQPWLMAYNWDPLPKIASTEMFDLAPRAGKEICAWLSFMLRRSTLTLAKRSDSRMTAPLSDDDFSQIVRFGASRFCRPYSSRCRGMPQILLK
jgi:hypothetical protein